MICEIKLFLQSISAMHRKCIVNSSLSSAIIIEENVLVIYYSQNHVIYMFKVMSDIMAQ